MDVNCIFKFNMPIFLISWFWILWISRMTTNIALEWSLWRGREELSQCWRSPSPPSRPSPWERAFLIFWSTTTLLRPVKVHKNAWFCNKIANMHWSKGAIKGKKLRFHCKKFNWLERKKMQVLPLPWRRLDCTGQKRAPQSAEWGSGNQIFENTDVRVPKNGDFWNGLKEEQTSSFSSYIFSCVLCNFDTILCESRHWRPITLRFVSLKPQLNWLRTLQCARYIGC